MGKYRIWLSPPDLAGGEESILAEALQGKWIAPAGPYTSRFERAVSEYTGSKFAVAVSSGTAAIHLALLSLGIGAGDEVICPSFTFAASVFPVLYQKARPVFVDSDRNSWNLSPELTEEAITDRLNKGKKIKAILAVHIYGQPADMVKLLALGERYEIPVIEDAAQALGAATASGKAGSLGRAGIFSFNGNKIITTSGGGMLISDDEELIASARYFSSQASSEKQYFHHEKVGYNYRMSDLLAAIGIRQMEALDRRVNRKREIFERYRRELGQYDVISFQPELPGALSNRWLTCILLDKESPASREQVYQALLEEGIESRYLMQPMHLQPVLKGFSFYGSGYCEQLFQAGICLPSGTGLSATEQDEIMSNIRKLLE